MKNEYIFFITTLLLCIVIYKLISMAQKKTIEEDLNEQRAGGDRRKTLMYRIPERRYSSTAGDRQERRGQAAEAISGTDQRRSGNERRKGGIRRQWQTFKIPENRKLSNRRDGLDRRKSNDPLAPVVA